MSRPRGAGERRKARGDEQAVWSAKAELSPFLAEAQLRRALPISQQVDYFKEAMDVGRLGIVELASLSAGVPPADLWARTPALREPRLL